jgi:hypothetical protein
MVRSKATPPNELRSSGNLSLSEALQTSRLSYLRPDRAPACSVAAGTRSAPGQDTRSGQGALARRHTDGPLRAALLKTTAMCKAWRLMHYARLPSDPSRTLFQQLISFSHYNSVLDTDTGTGPIPSITVSGVNAYSGGVLARALPEGLRYLST